MAARVVLEVVSSGPAAVRGDLNVLRMVLDNLLMNAIQAMAGVGRTTLSVSRQNDGMVAISIADTGVGIAPEIRDRVFEAFFTTKTRGTGLGLPTARRFVEAHGGTIDLLDRPGGGTIARVMLPSFD